MHNSCNLVKIDKFSTMTRDDDFLNTSSDELKPENKNR